MDTWVCIPRIPRIVNSLYHQLWNILTYIKYVHIYIYMCICDEVSWNRSTPSSILIGFSSLNQPFIGVAPCMEPPIWDCLQMVIAQCMSVLFYFNGKMFVNHLWGTFSDKSIWSDYHPPPHITFFIVGMFTIPTRCFLLFHQHYIYIYYVDGIYRGYIWIVYGW